MWSVSKRTYDREKKILRESWKNHWICYIYVERNSCKFVRNIVTKLVFSKGKIDHLGTGNIFLPIIFGLKTINIPVHWYVDNIAISFVFFNGVVITWQFCYYSVCHLFQAVSSEFWIHTAVGGFSLCTLFRFMAFFSRLEITWIS